MRSFCLIDCTQLLIAGAAKRELADGRLDDQETHVLGHVQIERAAEAGGGADDDANPGGGDADRA